MAVVRSLSRGTAPFCRSTSAEAPRTRPWARLWPIPRCPSPPPCEPVHSPRGPDRTNAQVIRRWLKCVADLTETLYLIFEDVHLCRDPASFRLLEQVHTARIPNLLVVCTQEADAAADGCFLKLAQQHCPQVCAARGPLRALSCWRSD